MNSDLIKYYKDRALEYEKIYSKPERQKDISAASLILQKIFEGKNVLEIACGTGYWTEKIAKTAKTILATDVNAAVIDIARVKTYSPATVTFGIADLYDLKTHEKFESLFGGFIWSHIKLEEIDTFIDTVNKKVMANGTVVFMDNNYVKGSNTAITYTDENGNTFQTRKLDDGSMHEVLKNFPSEDWLRSKLEATATEINFIDLEYFWILEYKNRGNVVK
jgi:2-polyprenyl-3-methyl-5-hydroxy-6-metoxy-1,4-benzoquinol methylase